MSDVRVKIARYPFFFHRSTSECPHVMTHCRRLYDDLKGKINGQKRSACSKLVAVDSIVGIPLECSHSSAQMGGVCNGSIFSTCNAAFYSKRYG